MKSLYFFIGLVSLASESFAQWQVQNMGASLHFRAISACSEKVVWVGGTNGTVLRTTDGGATWQNKRIPQNLDFRGVHGFDAQNALAMSAGEAEKGAAVIYRTTNGGDSWETVYQTNQKGVFLDAMVFWDKQNGIVLGDPIANKFFILTTSDGGKTWQETPRNNFPNILEGEAAFAASGTSLAVAGKTWAWFATGGGTHARVFRSRDRGQSWEAITTPLLAGKTSGIFGLKFSHRFTGWAVGGDYLHYKDSTQNLLHTKDGGKNWKIFGGILPFGLKESLAIHKEIQDENTVIERLIAVGPDGSGYSTDYGKTWKKLSDSPFHAVSFVGSSGWAVGPKGNVARFEGFRNKTK